jgi:hypothetical protein
MTTMEHLLDKAETLLEHHAVQGMLFTLLGLAMGWLLGRWRRFRLRRRIVGGDAREVVAIDQVIVCDYPDGRTAMRKRAYGSASLQLVLPNPVAHDTFLRRALRTTAENPLIDLKDRMGSYLLYLLTPWVCGMVRQGTGRHHTWIMAPVCEPGVLSSNQSSIIVLIRREDLARFRDWEACRSMQVEHGSDGARILTLWHMAREFDRQMGELQEVKRSGKRSIFVETMYLLDLALDCDVQDLPTKPVPWERFAPTLKALKLPV